MDFEKVFINKKEMRLLKSILHKKVFALDEAQLQSQNIRTLLHEYKFIQMNWYGASCNPVYNGTVSISKTGLDYLEYLRREKVKFWLKNAWIPIIVSAITTLLTNYISPKLPVLTKLLLDILSKTFS